MHWKISTQSSYRAAEYKQKAFPKKNKKNNKILCYAKNIFLHSLMITFHTVLMELIFLSFTWRYFPIDMASAFLWFLSVSMSDTKRRCWRLVFMACQQCLSVTSRQMSSRFISLFMHFPRLWQQIWIWKYEGEDNEESDVNMTTTRIVSLSLPIWKVWIILFVFESCHKAIV